MIVKNSEEEMRFIDEIIELVKGLNMDHIGSKEDLEQLVQEFAHNMDEIQFKYSKMVNITRNLRSWQNEECQRGLERYRSSRHLEDWKNFKSAVKKTKQEFLNAKIPEIVDKSSESWELMNWVKKRKLPAIKAIKYNRYSYLELDDLWQNLHESFNLAQHQQVNIDVLEEIPNKTSTL